MLLPALSYRFVLFALPILLQIELISRFLGIESGTLISYLCLAVISSIGILTSNVDKRRIRPNYSKFLWIISICIGYGYLSVLWSGAPNYGMMKLNIFVLRIITIIPISHFIFRPPINVSINDPGKVFLKYFIASAIFLSIVALVKIGNPFLLLRSYGIYDRLGIEGISGPISIGRYFGMNAMLFAVIAIQNKNKLVTMGAIPIALTLFTVLILSGSKGPLVSMILVLGSYLVLVSMRNNKGNTRLRTVFFITVIIIVTIYFSDSISQIIGGDYFRDRFSENTRSVSSRWDLMGIALRDIYYSELAFKVMGHGSGHYAILLDGYDTYTYPHNMAVELIYEYGAMLFTVYVITTLGIVKVLVSNISKNHTNISIISMLGLYFILNSMFSGDITHNVQIYIYYLLANQMMTNSTSTILVKEATNNQRWVHSK
jgi:hypothetical protein